MKVREFIEELKRYNPDAEITRDDSETICLAYLSDYDESTTPIVFVEKADYVDDRFED